MRVALLMVAVGDLTGSGGAERYFADIFEFLRRQRGAKAHLITSTSALRRLQSAGRVTTAEGVVTLPLGDRPAAGWLGIAWTTLLLIWTSIRHRFDVVHICLPTPTYVPFAAVMTRLAASRRPRITLNVIDCTVAANLQTRSPADLYERQVLAAHRMYARWTRIDGVFSWYRAFVDVAGAINFFAPTTKLVPARYCFADTERFKPGPVKGKVIVFAGRLSEQKRPLLFVDAVARLCRDHPQLTDGWRFEMYGRGELHGRIAERIAAFNLGERLTLTYAVDMAPIFARSRALVSTQALENFTSLAMLEAMASGNAIIAADVGQTSQFVRHEQNGFLVRQETPEAFAEAVADYLRQPQRHESFATASRALVTNVHTVGNSAADLISFWRQVLSSEPPASPEDHQSFAS